MLVLLLLFLSGFSRRRCEDLTFIYFRLVFIIFFNYEIVKMIKFKKETLAQSTFGGPVSLLDYWGVIICV